MASATDNFNRAGPSLGANWTGSVGSDLSIDSSIQATGASAADSSMYYNALNPTTDQYAQIVVATAQDYCGPLVRANATDWVILDAASADSAWKIEWYNGGSWTQIGTTYAVAPANADTAKIEVSGNDYTGYVNGTSRITGTNASTPATGNGGAYCYSNGVMVDDFEVGDLGGAPTENYLPSIAHRHIMTLRGS